MQAILTLLFFISAEIAIGQKFAVSLISDHLKSNANVVIRERDQTFTIASRNKATLHVHEVFTILNLKGQAYGEEIIDYDKLRKITSFSGIVYDASGGVIRKSKNTDIKDQSLYDGSLFSDNRLKIIDLSQAVYPYTVEFEYQIDFKYLFDIPGIKVIPEEKISVENTTYTLVYPKELIPRHFLLNADVKPVIKIVDGGKESISWSFKDIKSINLEPYGPPHEEIFPVIMAAPGEFEFDGYRGQMNTWTGFGQWINTLNKGREELSDATKQIAQDLTAKAETKEEKVKILYQYLQDKTRYVSIQLGIGGYQPFPATITDQVGYGDCKALSNYMVALLRAVNVPSFYALIKGGENQTDLKTTFPSSQFNHVIVAVPNQVDTIWLECTSQSNPFGYQGLFTGDRKALMVTSEGGKVVNTTHYESDKNIQLRKADVFLEPTGDAKVKVNTLYSGLQYENDDLNHIVNLSTDEQKKWLLKTIDIPDFEINSFALINQKRKLPSASVKIDLTLKRWGAISGKRIFVTPNLMNRSSFVPAKIENRKTNVVWKMAYEDVDTIQYHFPSTFYPEFRPESISFKSRFGEYTSSFNFSNGNLIYVRHIKMYEGVFPPESYNELVEFFRNINKADYMKIVLINRV